jgi:hypothetical protein
MKMMEEEGEERMNDGDISNSRLILICLPSLPSGLHSLELQSCNSLALPPILPEFLRKLDLNDMSAMEYVESLPDNLEELSLLVSGKLKELDHIPHKLKSLKIEWMKLFQIVNFNLPQTLEHLEISSSTKIGSGFEKYLLEMGPHTGSLSLPNLRELRLWGFKNLKILPDLPISLEKLVLIDCESIIESPLIPQNLKELRIYKCNQIQFLGSMALDKLLFSRLNIFKDSITNHNSKSLKPPLN